MSAHVDVAGTPPSVCFFYGTLMHRDILSRVIKRSTNDVETFVAYLQGYSRHRVKSADYPAIIPEKAAKTLVGVDTFSSNENSIVKGLLVYGLTEKDFQLLDDFEGNEYTRTVTKCYKTENKPLNALEDDDEENECQIYIWTASIEKLEPSVWSYEDFVRDKANFWISTSSNAQDI